jgi:hypothetical protein
MNYFDIKQWYREGRSGSVAFFRVLMLLFLWGFLVGGIWKIGGMIFYPQPDYWVETIKQLTKEPGKWSWWEGK